MDKEQIRKLAKRLSSEEIAHLRRLHIHGAEDVCNFGSDTAVLKSLEVHDLVFRNGAAVSLTHRGKLVARNL